MQLFKAKELAETLMAEHGLFHWGFEFDRAKRRFGCCHFTDKKITLSSELVKLNDEGRVKNTILHEIAHALVGSRHGHNAVWRAKAIEIGCDGQRCYTQKNTEVVKGKLTAVCPNCGHVHYKHRKIRNPNRKIFCVACSPTFSPNQVLIFQ